MPHGQGVTLCKYCIKVMRRRMEGTGLRELCFCGQTFESKYLYLKMVRRRVSAAWEQASESYAPTGEAFPLSIYT